jgi:hypothetical protein
MKSSAKACLCGVRIFLIVGFILLWFPHLSCALAAIFQSRPDVFPEFVNAIFQLFASLSSVHEKVVYITFLTHLYQSLEDAVVRRVALKYESILHVPSIMHGF